MLSLDKDEFVSKVMPFENHPFFDQPAAARTLIGMVRTLNQIVADEAGSAYISNTKDGISYHVNCDNDEIEAALPIVADQIDFVIGKNIMNALFPLQFQFRF